MFLLNQLVGQVDIFDHSLLPHCIANDRYGYVAADGCVLLRYSLQRSLSSIQKSVSL
jgi:hypothetical protein